MGNYRGSAVVGFILVPLVLCSAVCVIGWASELFSKKIERSGKDDINSCNSTTINRSKINFISHADKIRNNL